jgi:CheY-like chemotaxis protein
MDCSVLVVEDDRVLAETTRALLEWEGYQVRVALSGREALRDLRTRPPPCVVLLDLMMPDMNGWELMGALSRDPSVPDVPVVVVSAVTEHAPQGAAAVLRKPYEVDRLLEIVERLCGLAARRAQ